MYFSMRGDTGSAEHEMRLLYDVIDSYHSREPENQKETANGKPETSPVRKELQPPTRHSEARNAHEPLSTEDEEEKKEGAMLQKIENHIAAVDEEDEKGEEKIIPRKIEDQRAAADEESKEWTERITDKDVENLFSLAETYLTAPEKEVWHVAESAASLDEKKALVSFNAMAVFTAKNVMNVDQFAGEPMLAFQEGVALGTAIGIIYSSLGEKDTEKKPDAVTEKKPDAVVESMLSRLIVGLPPGCLQMAKQGGQKMQRAITEYLNNPANMKTCDALVKKREIMNSDTRREEELTHRYFAEKRKRLGILPREEEETFASSSFQGQRGESAGHHETTKGNYVVPDREGEGMLLPPLLPSIPELTEKAGKNLSKFLEDANEHVQKKMIFALSGKEADSEQQSIVLLRPKSKGVLQQLIGILQKTNTPFEQQNRLLQTPAISIRKTNPLEIEKIVAKIVLALETEKKIS